MSSIQDWSERRVKNANQYQAIRKYMKQNNISWSTGIKPTIRQDLLKLMGVED